MSISGCFRTSWRPPRRAARVRGAPRASSGNVRWPRARLPISRFGSHAKSRLPPSELFGAADQQPEPQQRDVDIGLLIGAVEIVDNQGAGETAGGTLQLD